MAIRKFVVVLDEDTNDEALYIDGKLVAHDSTIYSADISHHMRPKEAIYFEHRCVSLGTTECFHTMLEDYGFSDD